MAAVVAAVVDAVVAVDTSSSPGAEGSLGAARLRRTGSLASTAEGPVIRGGYFGSRTISTMVPYSSKISV